MGFEVTADAYDRFMGRYSARLAPVFADFAGVSGCANALDVGCGSGVLTAELVRRLGSTSVAAVDPSASFVAAVRDRYPGVDARVAAAEELPFPEGSFDAAAAQLVVHLMTDAVAGLREMRRVTRTKGIVAACVWDFQGERAPISPFWRAAREFDPDVADESERAGARAGHLTKLFRGAGLSDVEETALCVSIDHVSFEEWWEPFTLGVGPAGTYATDLDEKRLEALRERCRAIVPDPPFTLTACAWAARGIVEPSATPTLGATGEVDVRPDRRVR